MSGARDGSQAELNADTLMDLMTERISNEDLARRERRQQVRQACQHCRRRKIKCDEARPKCGPCRKGRLACGYELPAGQTRTQALLESQHRLRAELHSHTSMIHTLRHVDSKTSIQLLGRLRRGDYDGTLLNAGSVSGVTALADSVYPWKCSIDEMQTHELRTDMLSPNDNFRPAHNSSTVKPRLQPLVGVLGHPCEQDPGSGASMNAAFVPRAPPLGLQSGQLLRQVERSSGYGQANPF